MECEIFKKSYLLEVTQIPFKMFVGRQPTPKFYYAMNFYLQWDLKVR